MLGHVTRSPYLAFVPLILALVVLAYAFGLGRYPPRHDPPRSGTPAEIGVPYRVEALCLLPIRLGDLSWAFPERAIEPPPVEPPPWPFSIWATVTEPYTVPGVLTLSSATRAVFRADSDGSEFAMTAYHENPNGAGCL